MKRIEVKWLVKKALIRTLHVREINVERETIESGIATAVRHLTHNT